MVLFANTPTLLESDGMYASQPFYDNQPLNVERWWLAMTITLSRSLRPSAMTLLVRRLSGR
jgi:hypothetical protein